MEVRVVVEVDPIPDSCNLLLLAPLKLLEDLPTETVTYADDHHVYLAPVHAGQRLRILTFFLLVCLVKTNGFEG